MATISDTDPSAATEAARRAERQGKRCMLAGDGVLAGFLEETLARIETRCARKRDDEGSVCGFEYLLMQSLTLLRFSAMTITKLPSLACTPDMRNQANRWRISLKGYRSLRGCRQRMGTSAPPWRRRADSATPLIHAAACSFPRIDFLAHISSRGLRQWPP